MPDSKSSRSRAATGSSYPDPTLPVRRTGAFLGVDVRGAAAFVEVPELDRYAADGEWLEASLREGYDPIVAGIGMFGVDGDANFLFARDRLDRGGDIWDRRFTGENVDLRDDIKTAGNALNNLCGTRRLTLFDRLPRSNIQEIGRGPYLHGRRSAIRRVMVCLKSAF